jgi:4-diphosphocytidyl-2-C-methyl-D-erythritol kinase
VLGRREDGFHELETLFQAIDFADELTVELVGNAVELEVVGADAGLVPKGLGPVADDLRSAADDLGPVAENLAFRAAEAYRLAGGLDSGVHILLAKSIPVGAGLGGGSSDAAAVLRALNHLTDGAVAVETLLAIGADLGSDVPFFLCGSTLALARGRGEELTTLRPLPSAEVVLVCPPVHVATGRAYAALAERRVSKGLPRRAPLERIPSHWDMVDEIADNDFEVLVANEYPEVRRALASLRDAGMASVMLSGSGGACFGLATDTSHASSTAKRLREELGWRVLATRTLDESPQISPL